MAETTSPNAEAPTDRIPVGISSCLLGEEVRFDGQHKRDAYINGTLSAYFDFIPVCPEVAIGLGVPREPIRLQADKGEPVRVVGTRNPDMDVTEDLHAYGRQMAAELPHIHGYILKKGSPSCGMERVKVYKPDGNPLTNTAGAYAESLMAQRPLLPVEEEGRLGDPMLRENFIERVFVHERWHREVAAEPTPAALVAFHSAHKLLLMAHDQQAYRRLGQLVAEAGSGDIEATVGTYFTELMTALRKPATRKSNANVLYHLMGYLKEHLDSGDKEELTGVIESYRNGYVPLIVPITLLNHHFRRHPDPYVERQVYLQPHPDELMLRNRI
ncbi:YbgA family protein [Thiohalorhabdus sp.]|uniref:YbgA family protein n=1 Tax=Thiohalorhabdus sp. TaxID=3094134 RepID=UPI002FC2DA4B